MTDFIDQGLSSLMLSSVIRVHIYGIVCYRFRSEIDSLDWRSQFKVRRRVKSFGGPEDDS